MGLVADREIDRIQNVNYVSISMIAWDDKQAMRTRGCVVMRGP